MLRKNYLYVPVFLLFFVAAFPFQMNAQECEVLQRYDNGSWLIRIGTDTLLAITEETERSILQQQEDLKALREEVALKDSLIEKYEKTVAQYDSTLQDLRNYISELEGVKEEYRDLLAKYKQLKQPKLTMDAGIGITGKNTTPALMPGIAYKGYHLWTFFQRDNFGVMVGTSFRLW